ncbi:helix-turn-helix transcriptional regulator [Deefgea rivuli]|uniref:helix-turn-helix transcriptional regulator n=1 Tax=Deefgea rivuli TaxID=400948 RepID=UPI00056D8C5E|nr:hypothetical protein [Deefgea rivuli]
MNQSNQTALIDTHALLLTLQGLAEALKNPPRTLKPDDRLWDADTVADYLSVTRRHVIERYACLPDFPAAMLLPTSSESKAQRRWKPTDIRRWAERRQESKRSLN